MMRAKMHNSYLFKGYTTKETTFEEVGVFYIVAFKDLEDLTMYSTSFSDSVTILFVRFIIIIIHAC